MVATDVKDAVALVTGASSGIGEAVAIRLAREGAKVAVLARSEDELVEVARTIEEEGSEALVLAADVSDAEAMRAAGEKVLERWDRLDFVVANAGINGTWAPLGELEPQEWQKTLAVNLTGTFYTVKYALRGLSRQGGAVVVVSSVNGTRIFSNTGATAYACSKAAQVAFTKMIALELAAQRIRVNAVCPGAIETPIHEKTEQRNLEQVREPVEFPEGRIPLTDGRAGSPEQVAALIYFLLSPAADHITGSVTFIDGGESLLQG